MSEEILAKYYSFIEKKMKRKAALSESELKEIENLKKFVSKISNLVFGNLCSHFDMIIGSLDECFKAKKEDSDWEGIEEKFKKYSKKIATIFRVQSTMQ